jgi:hypothetical protein
MSCCYNDIVTWKDQKKTLLFLAILNCTYFTALYFKTSLISLFLQMFFFNAFFSIIKKELNLNINLCKSNCESTSEKESIEKLYVKIYDESNKYLDKLRNIILLNDFEGLIKLVICLFFLIAVGDYFSTLSILVLGIDIYILIQYKAIDEKIKESYNLVSDNFDKYVVDNIPKYHEHKIEKVD